MLPSIASSDLTLATVTQGITLRAIAREHGEKEQQKVVFALLVQVDAVCDGRNSHEQLMAMARMILATYPNLSLNSLVMALRDGMAKGKVFGKISYPLMAEWIEEHRRAVFDYNDNHYRSQR